MNIRYIVTGSEESLLLFEGLKKNKFIENNAPTLLLEDYIAEKSDFPIMIGGTGEEHEKTHYLSQKIASLRKSRRKVKINFDQHSDDVSKKDEGGWGDKLLAGTHIYHTRKAKLFSSLVWIDDLARQAELIKSIRNCKIHLTIDLDLLKEDYVASVYLRGTNKFIDLYKSIVQLSRNNEIIALDIFGASPYRCWDSRKKYALVDGIWLDNSTRIPLAQGEVKDIAPSFGTAVQHYGQLIQASSCFRQSLSSRILNAVNRSPIPKDNFASVHPRDYHNFFI